MYACRLTDVDCLYVCLLVACLPGGCKGTGQSHEDHLFALDVLENIDLLGIEFREELEVSGKLSQRHDCCLMLIRCIVLVVLLMYRSGRIKIDGITKCALSL